MEYDLYENHRPRGGALYGLLGFFAALGILYAAFSHFAWVGTLEQAVVVALGATFAGGFLSRKGGRGAKVGFAALCLPLLAFGTLLLAGSYAGIDGAEAVPGALEGLGEVLAEVLLAALGIVLIVVAFLAGVLGMVMGALGGWLSGRVFPVGGRVKDPDYLRDEDPWGREPW